MEYTGKYRVKTIPLTKLTVGLNGFVMPKCSTCKTRDCDNPIQSRDVSILGITRNLKVWAIGNRTEIVVDCDGYCE